MLLLDSGAQYEDGTTDVTRTMHFGEPTAEQKEVLVCNYDYLLLSLHRACDSSRVRVLPLWLELKMSNSRGFRRRREASYINGICSWLHAPKLSGTIWLTLTTPASAVPPFLSGFLMFPRHTPVCSKAISVWRPPPSPMAPQAS